MKQKQKKNCKKRTWSQKIFLFLFLGFFLSSVVFFVFLCQTRFVPFKYLLVIFLVLAILLGGIFALMHFYKKKFIPWILSLVLVLFLGFELFGCFKLQDTMQFLKKNLGIQYGANIYTILVHKDSSYKTIEDIAEKEVLVFQDMDDKKEFETALAKKVSVSLQYQEQVLPLFEKVIKDKEKIVIVNSGNYEAMLGVDETFEDKVRVLDTIELVSEIEVPESTNSITNQPFVVYISGIDTRSGKLPARSLSDVNIIMAVNPVEKRILLVHIPRDSYVQLHGTKGLKDKLTHAGTAGGIKLSMATVEDLLEIKIPYYIRLNFNSVVRLVDAIGGIEVYSDVNYSFSGWGIPDCRYYPGINKVNGRCALVFARERHAYETGDRHRGENQEQVIEKVIQKISTSDTLISKYSEILKALDGTFETNIPEEDITSLIRMQLEDMATWKIATSNINGSGAMLYTYSYPYQKLYVMNPDSRTIQKAVQKLNELVGEA